MQVEDDDGGEHGVDSKFVQAARSCYVWNRTRRSARFAVCHGTSRVIIRQGGQWAPFVSIIRIEPSCWIGVLPWVVGVRTLGGYILGHLVGDAEIDSRGATIQKLRRWQFGGMFTLQLAVMTYGPGAKSDLGTYVGAYWSKNPPICFSLPAAYGVRYRIE